MKTILLVEDEKSLGETLSERLTKENYKVLWAESIQQAEKYLSQKIDVGILDLGLPDGHGFDLAKKIQQVQKIPLLFVTAQSDAKTRLEGFELGAEEFIPKPFHIKELLIRVKHVIENHSPVELICFKEFDIDFEAMSIIHKDGEKRPLALRDFQILKLMIRKAPAVISRDEILDRVWGKGEHPSNRTIDNSIVRLRQALKDQEGEVIRSVRGVGYQWKIISK